MDRSSRRRQRATAVGLNISHAHHRGAGTLGKEERVLFTDIVIEGVDGCSYCQLCSLICCEITYRSRPLHKDPRSSPRHGHGPSRGKGRNSRRICPHTLSLSPQRAVDVSLWIIIPRGRLCLPYMLCHPRVRGQPSHGLQRRRAPRELAWRAFCCCRSSVVGNS
ncbi:hypothetical protein BJX96DRAFT_157152 [Aspergillus floccosus]